MPSLRRIGRVVPLAFVDHACWGSIEGGFRRSPAGGREAPRAGGARVSRLVACPLVATGRRGTGRWSPGRPRSMGRSDDVVNTRWIKVSMVFADLGARRSEAT